MQTNVAFKRLPKTPEKERLANVVATEDLLQFRLLTPRAGARLGSEPTWVRPSLPLLRMPSGLPPWPPAVPVAGVSECRRAR